MERQRCQSLREAIDEPHRPFPGPAATEPGQHSLCRPGQSRPAARARMLPAAAARPGQVVDRLDILVLLPRFSCPALKLNNPATRARARGKLIIVEFRGFRRARRSEEHTSELQSQSNLV